MKRYSIRSTIFQHADFWNGSRAPTYARRRVFSCLSLSHLQGLPLGQARFLRAHWSQHLLSASMRHTRPATVPERASQKNAHTGPPGRLASDPTGGERACRVPLRGTEKNASRTLRMKNEKVRFQWASLKLTTAVPILETRHNDGRHSSWRKKTTWRMRVRSSRRVVATIGLCEQTPTGVGYIAIAQSRDVFGDYCTSGMREKPRNRNHSQIVFVLSTSSSLLRHRPPGRQCLQNQPDLDK